VGGTGGIVGDRVGSSVGVGDEGVAVGDTGTLVTSGTGISVGATAGIAVGTRVEPTSLTVGGIGVADDRGTV
jgi:hypothetical protein